MEQLIDGFFLAQVNTHGAMHIFDGDLVTQDTWLQQKNMNNLKTARGQFRMVR